MGWFYDYLYICIYYLIMKNNLKKLHNSLKYWTFDGFGTLDRLIPFFKF